MEFQIKMRPAVSSSQINVESVSCGVAALMEGLIIL